MELTRRNFVTGTLAAMGGIALGGAQLITPKPARADDTIELTYWYCWTDQIQENNEERVQEFNDTIGAEKGIHVTAEYQGTYDDLDAKLKTAFIANEEPDVSVMVINSMRAFAEGGIIQPLTDLVAQEDIDDFWPGLMENCYVNDTLYGVPYLRSTPVIYYNKTLFEKAGLDASKAPETWDDVVAASDALKEVGVYGYGFYSYVWVLSAFTMCNGGMLFTDDIMAPSASFNEDPSVQTIEWLRDGVKNHNFSFAGGASADATLDTNAANQQVGMWCSSTANLTNYLQLASEGGYEISCGFIPKSTQNKVPTGGCNLVMTSRLADERKQAVADFINFMTNKDSAVKNHLKTGYLLTRQSDVEDERIKEAYAETPEYNVAFEQLEYAVGDYMNAGFNEAAKIYTDTVEGLMNSDDDIKSALDNAKSQADPLLAE